MGMVSYREGRYYEDLACEYLSTLKRYRIVQRNFRPKLAEVDLIAWDKDTLCFIEVKGRSYSCKYLPQEIINSRKLKKLRWAVNCYLKEKGIAGCKIRMDLLTIVKFSQSAEFYLLAGIGF